MSYTVPELVEVRVLNDDHKSLYARAAIPAGALIGFFDGKGMIVDLARRDELDDYWWRQSVHLKVVDGKLLCLMPAGAPDGVDFLNHSCRPNARVEAQIFIYADRDISPGEEITADYRTFNLVAQGIHCWCPEPQCVI